MLNSILILINNMNFLNKLLQILYKISIQVQITIIKNLLFNSEYIFNIIQLMKISENKFLLSKILINFLKNRNIEILNEVVENYNEIYKTKFLN